MLGAALRRSGLRSLAERSAVWSGVPRPRSAQVLSGRWLCSKPEDAGPSFKIPGHKPTDFEKKMLLWGGRFKRESDIPEFVSHDMVDAAKSKVRVKFAVFMMLLTILGCIGMVISGKQAAKQNQTLANMNLEKKARIKPESEK
ncbi:protein FAM162A isoform X2 [Pseudophryne corroboree]|uniref:protein FAM162A isoform X2 n=1 Tax=Pseudophryne corroboree TaxID=495146 RepID=UPI0030816698